MGTDKVKLPGAGLAAFKGSLSVIQDFYLEFFGTLVPGVVAVTSAVLLGLGFYYFIDADAGLVKCVVDVVFKSWEVGLLYLAISYIMGAIAYRRNPKTPDTISAHRQWEATKNGASAEEVGRLSVSFDEDRAIPKGAVEKLLFRLNREQWILRHAGRNIDYPYPHMRQYLCCRGLWHLAEYVPWCAGCGGKLFRESFEKGKCTKHYVNIIKQRLRNSGRVNLILDMMRNECNIRMLSSLWYILVFVRRMLECAIVVAMLSLPVRALLCTTPEASSGVVRIEITAEKAVQQNAVTAKCVAKTVSEELERKQVSNGGWNRFARCWRSGQTRIFWFFFIVALALALTVYCQRSIEFGFHYVRTREVTMILESAWVLDNVEVMGDCVRGTNGTRKSLFSDIRGMASDFKNVKCRKCKYFERCYPGEDRYQV